MINKYLYIYILCVESPRYFTILQGSRMDIRLPWIHALKTRGGAQAFCSWSWNALDVARKLLVWCLWWARGWSSKVASREITIEIT